MTEPDAPIPRRAGAPQLIGVAIAAILVAAAVSAWVLRSDSPQVTGLAPATPPPLGEAGELPPGPSRAWYSPDGTRLAVLTSGAAALARNGDIDLLTRRGGNVVDVAWFSAGTALLVAEGPTPTGGLVVVETSGTVRGTIPLEPVVAFGQGLGMAVAPGGKRAIVTAVERDPLGNRRTALVAVDLTTGATAPVPTGAGDARGPHYVDAGTIAFTRVDAGEATAVALDLGGGGEVVLGPGEVRGVIGAGEGVAVEHGASLVAYDPDGGEPTVLAASLDGPAVTVHPSGARAVTALARVDAVVLAEITLVTPGST